MVESKKNFLIDALFDLIWNILHLQNQVIVMLSNQRKPEVVATQFTSQKYHQPFAHIND